MKQISLGEQVFKVFNYIFMFLFSLSCIWPFYYVLVYSLSSPELAAQTSTLIFPVGFTFKNYISIFGEINVGYSAFISIARTVLGTGTMVIVSTLFAFIVTQKEMPYKKFIYRMVIATMYISGGLIPTYLLMDFLHLKNNFLVYILPIAIAPFNIVLVKTYIESLPEALEESAKIEGATPIVRFAKIIFPLCSPIIATIAIFGAVGQWNSWYDNFLYADVPELKTLQLLLLQFLKGMDASQLSMQATQSGTGIAKVTPTSVQMTITIIVTLPIVIVYPFFQKFFVKGILIGAVKG